MPSLSSPTQSMDTVYPEPLSRLHRRVVPRKRKGGSTRYRTQPVTFSEIQEVDEENVVEDAQEVSSTCKSELSLLNEKFEEFKRARDIDVLLNNNKIDEESPKNSTQPSSSRLIGKLPSRPSF